jgi:oligoendopeptidase F
MKPLPRWTLESIYPSLSSMELDKDYKLLLRKIKKIAKVAEAPPQAVKDRALWVNEFLKYYNTCQDLLHNLSAFAYMLYSINTADYEAVNWLNKLDQAKIPFISSLVAFRNALSQDSGSLSDLIAFLPTLKSYHLFLSEQLKLQKHQMTQAEEVLAADLLRPGADLWSRLQEALSSQTLVTWNKTSGEKKTIIELRALAHDPDRAVRKKAYELELSAWETLKIPFAYAINGVKGFSVILNKHRFYKNTLECSLRQARINEKVLQSLIQVMENALPHFRRYLASKARILKLQKMAFFDLFAPLGKQAKKWEFREAEEFIGQAFASFSSELGQFAFNAFTNNWIDALPRTGKVGGAYCISLPLIGQSRVLCNFDGSLASLTTLAHELGHAYHHHLLHTQSAIHREYPMTLAETASIFSENIIINSALKTFPKEEKRNLLELFLADSCQVIVDILSRYYFEFELMKLREEKELSADELCQLMLKAQQRTYGQGLDSQYLHPYMWAVKSHYYRAELAFYNFPYAFGLLFGLGLQALYAEQGQSFINIYKKLLQDTGRMNCMELGKEVGFDMDSNQFWQNGMEIIIKRINEFVELA